MKIILSRKDFDSANGAAASPLFDDGSAVSLPIDGERARRAQAEYANSPRHGGENGREDGTPEPSRGAQQETTNEWQTPS